MSFIMFFVATTFNNNANIKRVMKSFKHFELELSKVGKVSKHSTKTRGKQYIKAKVCLSDDAFVNKDYELYDAGEISIEEVFSMIKGRGLLIFFPEHKRKRETIGIGR